MASVGYATISIIPSFRGLRQNVLSQLNGPMRGAGGQAGEQYGSAFSQRASSIISKVGGAATNALKTGFTAAAVGTGAATAALTTFGVKGAASLETTTTAFTSLLGSSAAAQTQIEGLQKFAAATPFSQQDVLGYAQQFYSLADSVGMSKDQVQPFLTDIGDLGAVTGASTTNIKNAVQAIGQIGSSGKVSLDNLNQISEAFPGFNGAAAIASATGKTTAEVMTEISKGTLDASTGVQALLTGMKAFPGAAGAMAKQSQTLIGLFSTFKDTAQIALTEAFQPMVPVLKKTLDQVTPVIGTALSSVAPAIAGLVSAVAPMVAPLVGTVGTALTSILTAVTPAIKAMMPAVKVLADGLGEFAQAIAPAFAALAPVFKPLADALVQIALAVAPIIVEFAKLAAQVGPPLVSAISAVVTAVAPVVTAFVHALAPVLPVLVKAFGSLVAALAPLVAALGGAFASVIAAIVPVLAQIVTALAPVVTALAGALAPVLPVIANAFSAVLTALQPLISVLSGALTTILDALGPVLPVLAAALGRVAGAFAKILVALSPLIPVIAQLAAKLLTDVVVKLVIQVADAFTAIVNALLPLLPPLVSLVKTVLPPLLGFFTSLASALTDFVLPAIRLFGESVISQFQFIVTAADEAFGWVPWLGDKLDHARDAVDKLKKNWNDSFDAMKANSSLTPVVDAGPANAVLDGLAARFGDINGYNGGFGGATTGGSQSRTDGKRPTGDFSDPTKPAPSTPTKTSLPSGPTAAQQAAAKSTQKAIDAMAAKLKEARKAMSAAGGSLLKAVETGFRHHKFNISAVKDKMAAFKDAVKSVLAAGGSVASSAVATVTAEYNQLARLGTQLDKVAAKLATAKDKLASLKDAARSLRDSVRDTVTGSFDVATAGSHQDAFGVVKRTTGASVLADIKKKVKAAHSFAVELASLRKRGLAPELLAELAQAGPSAEPQARALYDSSQKTLNAISGQYGQLSKYGTAAGSSASQAMYKTGIATAQGIVDGLRSKEKAIENQMDRIGRIMAQAIKKALGIASPSTVAHGFGANFVQSLAKGSDDNRRHVVDAMQRVSDAMAVNPRQPGAASLSGQQAGGKPGTTVNQTFNHVQADPRVLAQEVARRLAALRQ